MLALKSFCSFTTNSGNYIVLRQGNVFHISSTEPTLYLLFTIAAIQVLNMLRDDHHYIAVYKEVIITN